MYNRVCHFIVVSIQTDIFVLWTNFSHYFGQKYDRKPKIEKFQAYFHPVKAVQSLLHNAPKYLCEIGILRTFEFFQFFRFKTTHFFLKSYFYIKNYSFDIRYVNVAQKIREWEGGNYCKFC